MGFFDKIKAGLTKTREALSGTLGSVFSGFSEIDVNGHVNNTKYANFVLDAAGLSSGEAIDTFQIEYHREIKKNSAVTVFVRREGKELLSKGVSDEGEKMFSCRIIFK